MGIHASSNAVPCVGAGKAAPTARRRSSGGGGFANGGGAFTPRDIPRMQQQVEAEISKMGDKTLVQQQQQQQQPALKQDKGQASIAQPPSRQQSPVKNHLQPQQPISSSGLIRRVSSPLGSTGSTESSGESLLSREEGDAGGMVGVVDSGEMDKIRSPPSMEQEDEGESLGVFTIRKAQANK